MNHTEKPKFFEILKSTCAIYGKSATEVETLTPLYWSVLEEYSLDLVQQAMRKHLKDPESGQFFPKPADLIRHIEGHGLTHDQIISAARSAKTPLGVLCRIHIGHWDLEHQSDMFYLKQRAEECLQLLPEWKSKALAGEYSDHQIGVMLKYGVEPTAPIHEGLPAPANRQMLLERTEQVSQSKRHQILLEQLPEPESEPLQAAENVRQFIRDEMEIH